MCCSTYMQYSVQQITLYERKLFNVFNLSQPEAKEISTLIFLSSEIDRNILLYSNGYNLTLMVFFAIIFFAISSFLTPMSSTYKCSCFTGWSCQPSVTSQIVNWSLHLYCLSV